MLNTFLIHLWLFYKKKLQVLVSVVCKESISW